MKLRAAAAAVPAERRSHGTEEAFHQSGDGQSPDGKEPVQGEADGTPGGHQMDRDDSVNQEDDREGIL